MVPARRSATSDAVSPGAEMRRIVLTGGPFAGKTALAELLRAEGFGVVPEAAIRVIRELTEELGPAGQVRWRRENVARFQARIAALQLQLEHEAAGSGAEWIVCDRGLHDGLAYCRHSGVEPPRVLLGAVRRTRYDAVFVLDTLSGFDARRHTGRSDDRAESFQLRDRIREVYAEHGYAPALVPELPIEERSARIISALAGL